MNIYAKPAVGTMALARIYFYPWPLSSRIWKASILWLLSLKHLRGREQGDRDRDKGRDRERHRQRATERLKEWEGREGGREKISQVLEGKL